MACCFAPKGAGADQGVAEATACHGKEPSVAKSGRSVFHLASENIKRFLRQKHLTRSELLQLQNDRLNERRKEQEQAQSVPYSHKPSGLACSDQLQVDNPDTPAQQPATQKRLQPLGYTSKQQGAPVPVTVNNKAHTVGSASNVYFDDCKQIPPAPGQQTSISMQGDRTSANRLSPGLHAAKFQAQRTSNNGKTTLLQAGHGSSRRVTMEDQCDVGKNAQLMANKAQFKDLIQPATDLRSAAKAIAEFQIGAATAAAEPVRSGTLVKEMQEPPMQTSTLNGIDITAAKQLDSKVTGEHNWRRSSIVNSSLHQWLAVDDKDLADFASTAPADTPQNTPQQDVVFNAAPLLGPGIGRHRMSGNGNTWSPPSPDLAAVRPHRATYTGSTAIPEYWKAAVEGVTASQRRMSQNGAEERRGPTSVKPPTTPVSRPSVSPLSAKQAWGISSEGDLPSKACGDGIIVVSNGRLSWKGDSQVTQSAARPGLAAVKRLSSAGGAPIPA